MNQNFTEAVTQALNEAVQYATEHRHIEVSENHLLRALLLEMEGYFASICSALNIDPRLLFNQATAFLENVPVYSGTPQAPQASVGLQQKLADAQKLAGQWNDSHISSDHLFMAYWNKPIEPFAALKKLSKKTIKDVEEEIHKIRGSRHMDTPGAESTLKALEKYCKNLTALAKEGQTRPRHRP